MKKNIKSLESKKGEKEKKNKVTFNEFFEDKYDLNNGSYNKYFLDSNNFKYNNSWDFYFTQNIKFDFTIQGLNKLKQEICNFYISMFSFDESEINVKQKYILGQSSINELNDISNKCAKNECIRIFSQIFIKNELTKLYQKNDFFKLFKHYFVWCLNKSFGIGKIQNKYKKTIFNFESIQTVINNLYDEGKIFNKEINPSNRIMSLDRNITKNQSNENIELKIEILNDDKIPILYYELNELNEDEKNFCEFKEFKCENGAYFQGSIYNKDNSSLNSSSSYESKNNNEKKEELNGKDEKNRKIINKSQSLKQNYRKHGLGREYYIKLINNKDIRYKYLGYYKKNKYHGFGILIKENEDCYFGEFRNGQKNGFGYFYTKKFIYKGFFYCNKKEGYGELINKEEGVSYCGNFANDKFNGYGYYFKENKFKYIGNFVDGFLNGLGLYIWNNGDKYYGNWSGDKMNGIGIYYYKDGDIFIGNYFNDKKNGKGQYIYSERKSALEGEWKEGIKNGKYKFIYFKDGNMISTDVRYINNKEVN